MGAARPAGLALVAFCLLFWSVFLPAIGQNPAGHLVVATDYEVFGTSELSGGGHVTWTLTGARASDLRAKILHLFDEYGQIPRGFPFAAEPTNANLNGVLESAEGVRYTDLLERVLEGAANNPIGTQSQYLLLFPFDLRETNDADPGVRFERSTSGLANTDVNATADVEVRFRFEAKTTTGDARVPLPTKAFADALYNVFSYEAAQSSTLAAFGPSPAWPFLVEGGWHIVTVGGLAALWAGNDSTGLYDNGTAALSRTSADPALASASTLYVPFDLRFASRAWATFNYTGQVADAGDRLRLEIARAPAFTAWTPLSIGSGLDLLPTAPNVWSNATVDLSGFLGQRVRLRWNFTSDAQGSAQGFFVRDFDLHAPAFYEGEIVEADTHYLIGTLSFSDPALGAGGIHLIRTPGGEILFYGSTWDASAIPDDTIRFRTFDVTENPQILFGIMLVASYVISHLQDSAYDRYREAHPAVYRPAIRKAKWLHNLGRAAVAVLILFYFVPTATWVVGLRVFVSGPAYWFLALSLALLLGFGTRAYYRRQLEVEPSPVVGEEPVFVKKVAIPKAVAEETAAISHCRHCLREIREGEQTYRCTCAAVYHLSCATSLMRCPNCRKPIAVEVMRDQAHVSMRCESCGEIQAAPEGTDPRAVTCANCGGRLRHLDQGKRYLIVASNPAIAFAWMRDLTKGGKPGLCMTPAAPERLRLEFGVKNVPIVQVSSHASGAVDPKKLDPAGLNAILSLAREGKAGVILYDGLDQIISEASIGDVIRFLRKANEMVLVHGVTVIGRVSPGLLADQELKRLNAEFDEYMDLSAQL